MPTFDEQIDELAQTDKEDLKRKQDFEAVQNKARREAREEWLANKLEKASKVAKYGGYAARAAGREDLAEMLEEGAAMGKEGAEEGLSGLRRGGSNLVGNRVAKLAHKGGNIKLPKGKSIKVPGGLSKPQAGAAGSAVSAALQGQGVKGIGKAALGGYVVNAAVVALVDMVSFIGFTCGLIYLNIHFVMSKIKKGQGFFVSMTWWQKGALFLADFILLIVPMLGVLAIAGVIAVGCNSSLSARAFSTFTYLTTFGQVDICGSFNINSDTGAEQATHDFLENPDEAEARVRAHLLSYGIRVNKPAPATRVGGLDPMAVLEIITLTQSCDAWARKPGDSGPPGNRCGVLVTGGNEEGGGHAGGPCSHLSGNKFDLSITPLLEQYIRNTNAFTPAGQRGSDPLYKRVVGGAVYAREGDHWDVVVGC